MALPKTIVKGCGMADSGICSLGIDGTFFNDGEGSLPGLGLGLLPLSADFWLLLSSDMMVRDFDTRVPVANNVKNL